MPVWLTSVLAVVGGGATIVALGKWVIERTTAHYFELRLAGYRSDLDRQAERLKHDLQREMIKAELGMNKAYEVAPKLLVKIKRAHGALVSVLGLSSMPDWGEYSRDDLESALDDRNLFPVRLLSSRRDAILLTWDASSIDAKEQVRDLYFGQRVTSAGNLAQRAHNYAVMSSVLLPADLAAAATETTILLVKTAFAADMVLVRHLGVGQVTPHEQLEDLARQVMNLEQRMRAVLAPAAAAATATAPIS